MKILLFIPFFTAVVSLFLPKKKYNNVFIQSRNHPSNNNSHYLETNEFLQNKKIINISPGGYKGFYMMGVANFIYERYDLTDYVFSGASAGSWISLIMCYKGSMKDIQKCIISSGIDNSKSIIDIENKMTKSILSNFKTEDFDLRRLFIGITTINNFKIDTTIVSDFESLEDAIDCCMASSHIPFITGRLTFLYKRLLSFDGGFSRYPYLNIKTNPVLHIHPNIWSIPSSNRGFFLDITDLTTLFSRGRYHFTELIQKGYEDSQNHREELDKIFTFSSSLSSPSCVKTAQK